MGIGQAPATMKDSLALRPRGREAGATLMRPTVDTDALAGAKEELAEYLRKPGVDCAWGDEVCRLVERILFFKNGGGLHD